VGDNRERRVFKVPVGDLNRKDSEKLIEKLMEMYKAPNPDIDY
jgi:hypothetical protein